jgi:hypothetical protein
MKPAHVATLAVMLMLWLNPDAQAAHKVEADKENVVSSKLEGTWEPDDELTRRLGGSSKGRISFTSDANVAAKIPAKYDDYLKGKRIYMAGVMTLKQVDHPFILIEHKGNPYVVYFRKRGEDPLGDAESFNVGAAVAKDTKNDLLFVGGDFNNQPFSAYRRVNVAGN